MPATAALSNENVLLARAIDEPAAFGAIYDHYFKGVYNYVRYRVDSDATADDLTALVFVKALSKLRSFRPQRAPFGVWLYTIARNTITDHLRASSRRQTVSLDALSTQSSDDPQPEQVAMRSADHDALLAAMSQLKRRDRDLLALKFGAGLTNRRIAELTGLSESNVGVILFRAIRRLREQMRPAIRPGDST